MMGCVARFDGFLASKTWHCFGVCGEAVRMESRRALGIASPQTLKQYHVHGRLAGQQGHSASQQGL